jgi:putative thioredoxin
VRGIPNVKAVVGGQIVNEFTGALPESAVREFIDALLPSPAEPLRLEALAARARGEADATRKLLLQAIHLDPRHEQARLDLIDVLLDAGDLAEAQRLLDEIAESARDRNRIESLSARLALSQGAAPDADETSLQSRLASDPADLDARLALSNLQAVKQDYRGALSSCWRSCAATTPSGRHRPQDPAADLQPARSDSDLVREFRGKLSALINR